MSVPSSTHAKVASDGSGWPVLLTVDEAAVLLRTTRRAMYAMVERGQLPGVVRIRRRVLFAVRLLRDVELVRLECQRRWPYVLVDEYQDTSRDQYQFVKLLLGPQQNLCVVGDDDQSIYRFRGAEVGNILAFKKQFPSAKVVTLETNYRSSGEVIDVANAVISQARKRHAKRLVAAAGRTGIPVRLVHACDELDEEQFIVREIKRLAATGDAEARA